MAVGGGRKFSGPAEKGKENPYSCCVLHSGRAPAERTRNLELFKDGDVRFLICTDVAARGIDIKVGTVFFSLSIYLSISLPPFPLCLPVCSLN